MCQLRGALRAYPYVAKHAFNSPKSGRGFPSFHKPTLVPATVPALIFPPDDSIFLLSAAAEAAHLKEKPATCWTDEETHLEVNVDS